MRLDLAILFFLWSVDISEGASGPGGVSHPSSYGSYGSYQQQQARNWNYPQQQDPYQQQPSSQNIPDERPLPPGWSEYVDPASGQKYYYNAQDGTTTWDRPEAPEPPKEEPEKLHAPPSSPDVSAENLSSPSATYPTESEASAVSSSDLSTGSETNQQIEESMNIPPESWRETSQSLSRATEEAETIDQMSMTQQQQQPGGWGMPVKSQQGEQGNIPEQREDSDVSEVSLESSELVDNREQPMFEQQQKTDQALKPQESRHPGMFDSRQNPPQHTSSVVTDGGSHDSSSSSSFEKGATYWSQPPVGGPPFARFAPQAGTFSGLQQQQGPGALKYGASTSTELHDSSQSGNVQQPIRPHESVPHPTDQSRQPEIPQQQQPQQRHPYQQQRPPYPQQYGPQQYGQYYGQRPPQQNPYPYGQYQRPPTQSGPPYNQYEQSNGHGGAHGQNYGQPQQQQGYGQMPGQGQLVPKEQPSVIRESLGSAWQGLLGWGNRTKEAVETTRSTIATNALEASKTISEKSSGWFAQAKNALGSVRLFDSSDDTASDYSLDGILRNPPPSARAPPSYTQQLQQPPQGYPQQSGYPPRGYPPPPQGQGQQQQLQQQPQFPPPQGRYPPGYYPPQPRRDVPYPHQQQGQPGQGQPPLQSQWGSGAAHQRPLDPNRPVQYPPPPQQMGGGQGQPGSVPPMKNPESNPPVNDDKKQPEFWQHPGLTSDAY